MLLHGRGADENDLQPLIDYVDPERRLLGATPRAPLMLPPGGYHWYRLGGLGTPDPPTFTESRELLTGWLAALQEETGFGPERTILGGFSQGGVMTYGLALGRGARRPSRLVVMSSFVPSAPGFELDLEAPLPPIAIGHGIYDQIIPVEWGRAARELLEGAGADVLYREYPLPHAVDPGFLDEVRAFLQLG